MRWDFLAETQVFQPLQDGNDSRPAAPGDGRQDVRAVLWVHALRYVPDADDTYERAVANGATALRPLAENYGARQGTIRDPFGHRWFICTALQADDVPIEDAPGR